MSQFPRTQEELDIVSLEYEKILLDEIDENTVQEITNKLHCYFTENNLKTIHIGISGGIDSAVAMELLFRTGIDVRPTCITFDGHKKFDRSYVEILNSANKNRGLNQIEFIDLSELLDSTMNNVGISPNEYIIEQTSYALRYQILFMMALNSGGITTGTTNRDELDYIGWFGKHSDMNVDIQFLHHYHKCQIQKLGKILNVDPVIIKRKPTGDLPSGKTDEECFGCSYRELTWLTANGFEYQTKFMEQKFEKIHELHRLNKHKYTTKELTHFTPIFL